jgi:soluble lytic murein transglycosylase
MAAVSAHHDGQHDIALAELAALVPEFPLLANQAKYLAGVSAYRAAQYEQALELARAVSADSPLRADAELVAADALRALRRLPETEEAFRSYVHRRRRGPRLAEATYRLGEAIEEQLSMETSSAEGSDGSQERLMEALRWYRRVAYRHPTSSWADRAQDKLDQLSRRLPPAVRRRIHQLSADEQLERAQAMARTYRHDQAMGEFEKVLTLTHGDGPMACQARLGWGRAAYQARQRGLAEQLLTETARRCDEPDIRAWALYLGARAATARGRDRVAVDMYQRLEVDHPHHRLADDARLKRALTLYGLGERDEAASLLRSLPDQYPQGDMGCDAQWQLGWRAYRGGDYDGAQRELQRAAEVCEAPDEGAGGRETYWRGRALARLGRSDEALEAYQEVVQRFPLSYYMVLAIERLDEANSALARHVEAHVAHGSRPTVRDWTFDAALLRDHRAYIRGIELHRLGLSRLAAIEFAAAGSVEGQAQELRWLTVLLHHEVGDYAKSHWIARRELTQWQAHYPWGAYRPQWLLAYPQAFRELVLRAAADTGLEPALVWAIMREESAFSPTIESPANAVGLLQLLPTTAERFAEGGPASAQALRDPAINVQLGSRYLSWLKQRYEGSSILAVAAYNAGEGSVRRWRRRAPNLPFDEALESFSYLETRRYTRRVLSSYATYRFLYEGSALPRFLNVRPTDSTMPTTP